MTRQLCLACARPEHKDMQAVYFARQHKSLLGSGRRAVTMQEGYLSKGFLPGLALSGGEAVCPEGCSALHTSHFPGQCLPDGFTLLYGAPNFVSEKIGCRMHLSVCWQQIAKAAADPE